MIPVILIIAMIVSLFYGLGGGLLIWALNRAPLGYEDAQGFHYGPEPTPAPVQKGGAS